MESLCITKITEGDWEGDVNGDRGSRHCSRSNMRMRKRWRLPHFSEFDCVAEPGVTRQSFRPVSACHVMSVDNMQEGDDGSPRPGAGTRGRRFKM